MNTHDLHEKSHGADKPYEDSSTHSPSGDIPGDQTWSANMQQTLRLGEQVVGFATGVVDLARVEVLLAMRTLPNLLMLWLLMMPIMLLTWIAFCALMAWAVYEASEELGLGMLIFFLQQVLLLLVCRWFYVKYRLRLTLPNTRSHIDNFIKGMKYESGSSGEAQK